MTFKPDKQHSSYTNMLAVWKACRDANTGQRAIKEAGETYLPRLTKQENEAYAAYLLRAVFFNATGRTVDALVGLIFRKKPVYSIPVGAEDWVLDINLAGKTLEGFARQCVKETVVVGRLGILVDMPVAPQTEPGTAITVAEARAMSLRPYATLYRAESIINWEVGRLNGVTKLINVFLCEDDNGKSKIRQLTLQNGYYEQIVWIKTDKEEWIVETTATPVMDGSPLKEIPFYFLAPEEPDSEIQNSPIEDLAYVNIAHYRNSADYENGLHLSGLPTPYVTGVQGNDLKEVHLGGAAWAIPDKDSKVGFLQVGAEGFTSLEKGMESKEMQMAALGARIIAPEKKAAEAAETAGIRRGGENSVLSAISGSVEMQILKVLQFMAKWQGIEEKFTFELNKDYLPTPMDAAMLTALLKAVQSGDISEETFFETLKAGEVVAQNLTFEDEQERKAHSTPSLGPIDDNQ